MTVYILSILFLASLAAMELTVSMSARAKRVMAFMVYGFLVLQIGLRWETGTDWNNYLQQFNSISTLATAGPSLLSPEVGYNLAIWLLKLAFSSYSSFLLIHAAVYYGLIFNSIERYTGMLFPPLLLFYSVTMGVTGSNRELIALAIGMYALRYVQEGKTKRFFLLVILACMFHYSAVILVIFPLFRHEVRPYVLVVLLICAIAIGASPLPELGFGLVGRLIGGGEAYKAAFYLANTQGSLRDSGLSVLGLVKRVVLAIVFIRNRRSLVKLLPYYNVMLNAYIAGIVLYFLFARSLLIVVNRGSLYFDVMEPLLLASQVFLLRRRSNRIVMTMAMSVLSVVLLVQSIAGYPDLFVPYKGLFINTDYSRRMY